jgi:hypothetical protein
MSNKIELSNLIKKEPSALNLKATTNELLNSVETVASTVSETAKTVKTTIETVNATIKVGRIYAESFAKEVALESAIENQQLLSQVQSIDSNVAKSVNEEVEHLLR